MVARQLCAVRGVAEISAAVFSAELFGTRTFRNGRQLGAVLGLVPVPYRRDQRVQDQGISRAGRADLRRIALQLAWCWVRWQRDSALTQWFQRRFVAAGGRSKRIGIVAVTRKLAIALWRYVEHGVVPEGARVKASRDAPRARARAHPGGEPLAMFPGFPSGEPSDRWSGSPLMVPRMTAVGARLPMTAIATDRRWSGRARRHTDRQGDTPGVVREQGTSFAAPPPRAPGLVEEPAPAGACSKATIDHRELDNNRTPHRRKH